MHGTKVTNTTPVDCAKTGGQTFLCNHYAGEDPKTHEAIKKLNEKLEAILKLLQGNAPPISPGEKWWDIYFTTLRCGGWRVRYFSYGLFAV